MKKMSSLLPKIGEPGSLVRYSADDIFKLASRINLGDTKEMVAIEKAIDTGPDYDAGLSHPRRRWWVWGGTLLISLGFFCQALGSLPNGVAWLGICKTDSAHVSIWCP
jgi:hypothetical protein